MECGRALFLHHDTSSVGAISRSRRTLNPHDATIGRALFHDVDTNSTCAGADVLSESRDVVGTIIKTAHSCGGPSNEDKKNGNWIRKLQGERHGLFSNFTPSGACEACSEVYDSACESLDDSG